MSDINAGLPVVESDGLTIHNKLSVEDEHNGKQAPEGVNAEDSAQKQDDSGSADHGDAAEGNVDQGQEGVAPEGNEQVSDPNAATGDNADNVSADTNGA